MGLLHERRRLLVLYLRRDARLVVCFSVSLAWMGLCRAITHYVGVRPSVLDVSWGRVVRWAVGGSGRVAVLVVRRWRLVGTLMRAIILRYVAHVSRSWWVGRGPLLQRLF